MDDDIYVNVPMISEVLHNFTSESKVYIGPECGTKMPVSFKYNVHM